MENFFTFILVIKETDNLKTLVIVDNSKNFFTMCLFNPVGSDMAKQRC